MHGVAAPASIAAQHLGEVLLGAHDPTAKRRVFHAAQVLEAHGVGSQSRDMVRARSPDKEPEWGTKRHQQRTKVWGPSATNKGRRFDHGRESVLLHGNFLSFFCQRTRNL